MPAILEREVIGPNVNEAFPSLRPLNDLVYVRQDTIPLKSGEVYLPDSTRKHKAVRYGTVLAVGPGRLVCREEVLRTDGTLDLSLALSATLVGGKVPVYGKILDPSGLLRGPITIGGKMDELVVSVAKRIPVAVGPGDRVMFMDFAGTCVGAETDPSLLLMREDEIMAVVREFLCEGRSACE
jgi:co-chaperonin GroES (HSP10)